MWRVVVAEPHRVVREEQSRIAKAEELSYQSHKANVEDLSEQKTHKPKCWIVVRSWAGPVRSRSGLVPVPVLSRFGLVPVWSRFSNIQAKNSKKCAADRRALIAGATNVSSLNLKTPDAKVPKFLFTLCYSLLLRVITILLFQFVIYFHGRLQEPNGGRQHRFRQQV